jgi:hypothetical protein
MRSSTDAGFPRAAGLLLDGWLSTSLRRTRVSLPAVRAPKSCAEPQLANVARMLSNAAVGARTTPAVELVGAGVRERPRGGRFMPYTTMTILPWVCVSPWWRSALGRSLNA